MINRWLSIELLYQEIFEKNESIDEDAEWMEQVELIIQPHPRLPRNKQRAVEEEFRMQGGVLLKEVKKAQVGYLLNSWNVDSTVDADLKGHHVLLHLKNAEDIKKMNIESFLLAPSLD